MHAKTLQIRDVPAPVYERLKRSANIEHRSLSQQALESLELGLMIAENQAERRQKMMTFWKEVKPIKWSNNKLAEPYLLIREDRER